jgi:hypothetical protein
MCAAQQNSSASNQCNHVCCGSCCCRTRADDWHDAYCAAAAEAVAKRRRMPAGMGFSFFIESSFVELHNEQCHDLYAKGTATSLPVSVWVQQRH